MQRVNIGGSKGSTPTIACINRATVDLGVDFASLIAALQKYVDQHVAPVWGTPAKLVRATKPRDNAWTMLFVDTAAVRNLRQDLKKMFGKHAKQVSAFHFFKKDGEIPISDRYAPVRKARKSKLILRASPQKRRELRNENNRDLHRSEFR